MRGGVLTVVVNEALQGVGITHAKTQAVQEEVSQTASCEIESNYLKCTHKVHFTYYRILQ